jgi:tripartite-type tricarboxylate transporter receptor subunit TctC
LKTSEEDAMLQTRFHALGRNAARLGVLACAALACAPAVHAQQYPTKPVRIVVGYPPGGAVDALGRIVGQQLSQAFGQQFIVENRGGASGIIGADVITKSPPDGYSLIVLSGAHAVNPSLYKKLP